MSKWRWSKIWYLCPGNWYTDFVFFPDIVLLRGLKASTVIPHLRSFARWPRRRRPNRVLDLSPQTENILFHKSCPSLTSPVNRTAVWISTARTFIVPLSLLCSMRRDTFLDLRSARYSISDIWHSWLAVPCLGPRRNTGPLRAPQTLQGATNEWKKLLKCLQIVILFRVLNEFLSNP